MNKETEPVKKGLTPEEEAEAMPKAHAGVKITFKKEPKKDKIKKLLGDRLKGMIRRGDEITIVLDVDDLSDSDKDKIQKIVDGE